MDRIFSKSRIPTEFDILPDKNTDIEFNIGPDI